MQVTYNGLTGELVKLERGEAIGCREHRLGEPLRQFYDYDLSIYDSEKQVTHSFTGVKFEDMKFHGVVVTFGG